MRGYLFHPMKAYTWICEYLLQDQRNFFFLNVLLLSYRTEQCLTYRRCLTTILWMNMCSLYRVPYNLIYSIPLRFFLWLGIFPNIDCHENYERQLTKQVNFLDFQIIVLKLTLGFLCLLCQNSLIFSITLLTWKFKGSSLEECLQSFESNIPGQWQPTPVFLPEEIHRQRNLGGL